MVLGYEGGACGGEGESGEKKNTLPMTTSSLLGVPLSLESNSCTSGMRDRVSFSLSFYLTQPCSALVNKKEVVV